MGMLKRRLAMLLAAAMLFTSVPVMDVTAAENGEPAVEETTESSTEATTETPAPTGGDTTEGETPAPEGNEGGAAGEETTTPAVTEGQGTEQTTEPTTEGQEGTVPAENQGTEETTEELVDGTVVDEAADAVVKAESVKIVQKGKKTTPTKVNVGSSLALEVVAEPEGAEIGEVIWSSSDESVVTVSADGVVKGIVGTTPENAVTITARSADDSSLTASITLQSYAGTWVKKNGKWKFKLPNGKYAKNKFVTIDGKIYYLASDEYMETGWFTASKKKYYANGSGVVQRGWKSIKVTEKVNGKNKKVARNYYFGPATGMMNTGWRTINGKYYYFASDGKNQKSTGWAKISGKWYYMEKDEDGHICAATGWQEVKGKWYYLDPSKSLHGEMKTGWFTETVQVAATQAVDAAIEGDEITADMEEQTTAEEAVMAGTVTKTYYFNKSGASVTGLQTISGKKYLFVEEGGKGVLAEADWTSYKDNWYYVNPTNNVVTTGQATIDGEGYYFDTKTGVSRSGLISITTGSGKSAVTKSFYYEKDAQGKGVMVKDRWIDDGPKHYLAGADGQLLTGSQERDGQFYYFDAKTCAAKGGVIKIDGKSYLYADNADGRPARVTTPGKYVYNNKPYFINDDAEHSLKTGFVKDGEDTYYYKSDFNIATGWQKDNNIWYYFDPDTGKMQTGWIKLKDIWYYLKPENGAMVTGPLTIEGDGTYYFGKSGAMQKGVVPRDGGYYAYDNNGRLVTSNDSWKDPEGNTWKVDANGKITNYNKKIAEMDAKANKGSGASSSTNWLIMANKSNHMMGIYEKSGGKWVRRKTWAFHSADGQRDWKTGQRHITPSRKSSIAKSISSRKSNHTTGTNGVRQRDFGGSTGFYCTYINSGFFIHTLLYKKGTRLGSNDGESRAEPKSALLGGQTLKDGINASGGKNISHGCIRVNWANAKYVYFHIPGGTAVWVYGGSF